MAGKPDPDAALLAHPVADTCAGERGMPADNAWLSFGVLSADMSFAPDLFAARMCCCTIDREPRRESDE
jgi:hypothetical protein